VASIPARGDDDGRPPQLFGDQAVIRIASADSQRAVHMPEPQLLSGELHGHPRKLVRSFVVLRDPGTI
jgi:hypothetical protein